MRQRQVRVVMPPIGAAEPHANHLAYAHDTWTADAPAARVAARANSQGAKVLVLPAMPYGVNTNQAPNPNAQSIRPATMTAFAEDTVETLEQHGIRKLVIFIRPWKYVSDNTGLADPTKATAASGQKLIDLFMERISDFLEELSDAERAETFSY